MLENIFTLLMLVLLQAVLGFDNLLYISLESKKAPEIKQIIVLLGGGFIIYTAIKEIWHMIGTPDLEHSEMVEARSKKTANAAIVSIVIMNLVFSFDSILAAIGLTSEIENSTTAFIIMAIAIVVSGLLMLFLADRVSAFLAKNKMYEVLGLFILFIVGIMLVTEGGHLAHIKIFGNEIVPMSKTTFYFVIVILIITDIVQGKYQKKLLAKK